jgi:DNA replication protein DnaD
MARAMFEYTKVVLEKVSFDTTLFCRELQKAFDCLLPFEIQELKIWLKEMYLRHPDLVHCEFPKISIS